MNKIIAFALLILALSALENTESHQQARPFSPTPTPYPASNFNYRPPTPTPTTVTPFVPVTPATAAPKVRHQPHREPGYQPTPGNPFGRDPQGRLTCFQSPCYDPLTTCRKTVRVNTRPVARASTRLVNGRPVTVTTRSSTGTTTQAQVGTWKAIIYVVKVNGRKARFAGFRCVWGWEWLTIRSWILYFFSVILSLLKLIRIF